MRAWRRALLAFGCAAVLNAAPAGAQVVQPDLTVTLLGATTLYNEDRGGRLPFVLSRRLTRGEVSVDWRVVPRPSSTAIPGLHYGESFQTGTVTWRGGDNAQQRIIVPVIDNDTGRTHVTERFTVRLENLRYTPDASSRSQPETVGYGNHREIEIGISADEHTISIDSPSVREGPDGETTTLDFTVTYWPIDEGFFGIGKTATTTYAVTGGTAAAGDDYVHTSGELVFTESGHQTISVEITGDNAIEPNETVEVTISDLKGVGGGLPDLSFERDDFSGGATSTVGVGTIINDDGFTIDSPEVVEGPAGATTTLAFEVTAPPSTSGSMIDYTVGGTATPGEDYDASFTSGTLTFAPDEASKTLAVEVNGDGTGEDDETVVVTLSNPRGLPSDQLVVTTATGTGTILNDDHTVSLMVDQPSVDEGAAPQLTFTATMDRPARGVVTVEARLLASSTAERADFEGLSGGFVFLRFTPGQTSKTFTVDINDDDIGEADETLIIGLVNPVAPEGSTFVLGSAASTILNDDYTLWISSGEVAEGHDGSMTTLAFTVGAPAAPSGNMRSVMVDYTVGGTATRGEDYDASFGPGTLAFAVGEGLRTLEVEVNGDNLAEDNETVLVTLSNPRWSTSGGEPLSITMGTATGTIVNDDYTLSIDSPSVDEGADGAMTPLTFTVSLAGHHWSGARDVTVEYQAATSSTAGPDDHSPLAPGRLTFAPGVTEREIEVTITGDDDIENDETLVVELLNPRGPNRSMISIAETGGSGTIRNDDGALFAIVPPGPVAEGASGSSTPLAFTVTLTGREPGSIATVNYSVSGTATSGDDYDPPAGGLTGTLTFNDASATSMPLVVTVRGDDVFEPDETVMVTLASSSGARITAGQGEAVATIRNDDPIPLSIGPADGDESAATLAFDVTLGAPSSEQVTFRYRTAGGSATPGEDFQAATSVLVAITPGATSARAEVAIVNDTEDEDDETVVVEIFDAAGAAILPGGARGTGTIRDDDVPGFSIDSPRVAEGDAGPAMLAFMVTLDRAPFQDATVTFEVLDTGTATEGVDYAAPAGNTRTIGAGATSTVIEVTVNGDTTGEPDETVVVMLTDASANATILQATGTGRILDDDPVISIGPAEAAETGDGTGESPLEFTVTMSKPSPSDVTVAYEVRDVTTTAGEDYRPPSGNITIPASATSAVIALTVLFDQVAEDPETLEVVLRSTTGGSISPSAGTGTGTIFNSFSVLTVDGTTVVEGDANATATLAFRVTLDRATTSEVRFTYVTTMGGTATPGEDFQPIASPVMARIPGGGTSTTAEVMVIGDDVYEGDETVEIELTGVDKNSVFPGGGTAVVRGTIEDNELPPQLTVSARDITATEPSAGGASTLVFTATLSRASFERVVATYEVIGTAEAGADYREPSGTFTIPAGATSAEIAIGLLGDDVAEAPETLTVRLVGATGDAAIPESGRAATTEILDHNPVLTIGEAPSVVEGGAGTTATLTFTVALDRLAASAVEFTYETTTEGTAEPGRDFQPVAPPRRASIPVGGTSTTATVTVVGDDGFEPDETVVVAFEIEAGVPTVFPGGVKTAAGAGTIRNDDRLEFAVDSPAPVREGPSGSSTPVVFTVTLEGLAPGGTASVDYGLSGTATAGVDYEPPAAGRTGTLTFANDASATSTTVSETVEVTVLGDDAFDPDETVVVTLSNPSGGGIAAGRDRGEAVISNDDLVSVSIGPAAPVTEGAMGTTATLDFEVTLGAAVTGNVVVRYRTGTGGTATPGEDYRASTSTLTINSGDTLGRIPIPVIGDDRDEDDETVEVELLGAVGAMLADGNSRRRAIGTIRDDDEPEFSVVVDRPAVEEGGPGDENPGFTFTVTLDPPSFRAVTVDYGVGGTAANGDDYGPLPGGRLTFAAGATSSVIVARVNGDNAGEDDETVVVTLSNPSGARIAAGRNEAVATIRNDDLTLTIDSPEEAETKSGTATLTFTVALSEPTSEDVMVEYRITGGTATAGEDYEAPSGTVLIPAGRTSATIAVTVNNDGEEGELPETVEIELVRATSGTLDISNSIPTGAGGRGKGTILDDEPVLTVGSPGGVEEGGAGAGMSLMFAVTLDRPAPSGGVTVDYSVGGTATQGVDYSTPSPGSLTFAPGATTTVLDIRLIDDDVVEPDETVTVTLSNAVRARFAAGAGMIAVTGTILNDDRLELSIDDPSGVMEGAAGTTTLLTFTVSLSATTSADVAVGYRVGGTATAGEDYAAPSGAVTIPAGALSAPIAVVVVGDDAGEADETVVIELLDPPGETGIRKGTGTGTILNDDLRITIDSPEATEPGSGTAVLTFMVELSSATSADVEVEYRIAGGTATAGEDYVAPSGAVTILANTTSAMIAVTVNSDGEEGEISETVVIELVRATSGGIDISGSIPTGAGGSGEGRILNDRPVLTLEPDPDGGPEFVMELDRQAAASVRVLYEVRTTDGTPYRAMTDDGMVTSGDGGPREGTFTIAAGAATAVLAVEPVGGGGFGADTLAVTLSNPTAGAVFPGGRPTVMATGPRAGPASSPGGSSQAGRTKALTHVLAGVGRALAGSIVDLIWDRAESHRHGARESHATVGGRSLDTKAFAGGGGGGDGALRAAGALAAFFGLDTDSPGALLRKAERRLAAGGGLGALRDWADLPDGRDLLGRSGFAVSFANGPDGGSGGLLAVWARTSLTAFESGLEDGGFGSFSAEGDVMAGHLGFDYRVREGVLAGIALGLTGSSIDYGFKGGSRSEIETEIVSVHPYLHWMSPAGLGVWGSVGYGAGTAEIDEKPGILETDLTMQMAAGGVRNGFASMGAIDLAVKADAFVVGIAADEVADGNALRLGRADADSSRARLALEGSSRRATETGGVITGRFEVGARYDGGDAEEGAGADIAAGFKYAVPGRGLKLQGRGSLLLAHEEGDFEEWGLGLGLAWAPGPSGRGLRLSVEPGWGVPPSGASASLWNAGPGVHGRPAAAARGASLDARLGYGLGVLGDRGLVTVFGELGRTEGGGRLRLGAEFRQAGESGLGIELYGERLDRPAGPDHSAGLKGRIGF